MVSPRLAPSVQRTRQELERIAARWPMARRIMERAGHELVRAARGGEGLYDGSYFGEGRNSSGDREGRSGYATYDRISSNADVAAYCLWRNVPVDRALDVGCAKGYLVEALRELGIDAEGCDVSNFAVEHPAPGAQGHVRVGDLSQGLPYEDGEFPLVACLETLEHLEPDAVPYALTELRRVCGGVLVTTIPSFGPNASGPDGHLEGKVRPERLDHYKEQGESYSGPVPFADLAVDAEGVPIEGHLTIASYGWWTERFTEAGFTRWTDVERRIYADIHEVELDRYWNLYVLAVPGAPADLATPRSPEKTLPQLGLVHPLFQHAAANANAKAEAEAEAEANTEATGTEATGT